MGAVTPDRKDARWQLRPPERLTSTHELDDFDSGRPQLDQWLRHHAARDAAENGARAYVVCQDARVVAFYCLANAAVLHAGAPGRVGRDLPAPIPVMVLGRLAVDRRFQGQGLGRALLRDAILRALRAGEIAGVRALLAHAKDERARAFYERSGFVRSPFDPLTLMLI